MSGKIYLLQDDGQLHAMTERTYVAEERLQVLLRDYPDLLAGDQIDEEEPRRWLLISREVGVPFEEDGREWMSLDHLFLDQDGIPTLVEVKRSSDTRLRREVVGQMLDYASHAVAYWSLERLRTRFETVCDKRSESPDDLVVQLIGSEPSDASAIDDFWTRVETNLKAGKIRLIFLADEIPSELRRIVEFLNTYTSPVEVLAVEVRQYVGENLKALVPHVIGQTAQAMGRKSGARMSKRKWDEQSFFKELDRREGAEAVAVAQRILDWARAHVTRVWWGEGKRNGSFVPVLNHNDVDHQLFAVWTGGSLEVYFYWYQYKQPFDSEEKRRALLRLLNAIEGISIPEDAISRRPSIPLEVLAEDDRLNQVLSVFEWVVDEITVS
jgi:hypothetical protein